MLSLSSERVLRDLLADAAVLVALTGAAVYLADVLCGLAARTGRLPAGLARLERRTPRALRRLAELTVTAALATGTARPVSASTTPVRDWLSPSTTTAAPAPPPPTPATTATTVGSPRPATSTVPSTPPATEAVPSPSVTARPTRAPVPAPVAPTTASYVVRPGDCLWRIAAARLGPRATNAAVDAAWRALYAANRSSIGDDPNLIHPGLVLSLPPLPVAR